MESIFQTNEMYRKTLWTKCRYPSFVSENSVLKEGYLLVGNKFSPPKLKFIQVTPKKIILKDNPNSRTTHLMFLSFKHLQEFHNDLLCGFRLWWNNLFEEFSCSDFCEVSQWKQALRPYVLMTDIQKDIEVCSLLTKTKRSTVYLGQDKSSSQKVVIKAIRKTFTRSNVQDLTQEIRIMRDCLVTQSVKLLSVYEHCEYVYLVMEFLPAMDFLKLLKLKKGLPESQAVEVVKKLLCIVSELHSKNIVHRDLKLENLLLYSDKDISDFRLGDFGLATYMKNQPLTRKCGTVGYMAPEVLNSEPYTSKADVFSIGVVFCTLLLGYNPVLGLNQQETMVRNMRGFVHIPEHFLNQLSTETIEAIYAMTAFNPEVRPSCQEALKFPIFSSTV